MDKDGYCEVKDTNGQLHRIVYEYNGNIFASTFYSNLGLGCRFHQCPYRCMESVQTREQFLESQKRISAISAECDKVIQMTSCEWQKLKKSLVYKEIQESGRLPKNPESESEILEQIIDGRLYGLAKGKTQN